MDLIKIENEGVTQEVSNNEYLFGIINEANSILAKNPTGNVIIEELKEKNIPIEDSTMDSIVRFYWAVFGQKPWGVLLDDETGVFLDWDNGKNKILEGSSVSEDSHYTKEAIKKFLLEWFKQKNNHSFWTKDENNNIYSFCAWFEHDNVESLISQIYQENYEGDEEWIRNSGNILKERYKETCKGNIMYIADMATHPLIRDNIKHTAMFWSRLFKQLGETYIKSEKKEGLTITLRTSGINDAPLYKVLRGLLPNIKPVFEEPETGIIFYSIRIKDTSVREITEILKEGNPKNFISVMKILKSLKE